MEPLNKSGADRAGADSAGAGRAGAGSSESIQVLDLQQVEELRDVLEDEFSAVIEAYLKDAERKVECVLAAADTQDAEALRHAAHSLKGSCRNVGARQLAESCQVIESLAYEDQLDDVPLALLALRSTFLATRSAFLGAG